MRERAALLGGDAEAARLPVPMPAR
jgi:hypothetical protein